MPFDEMIISENGPEEMVVEEPRQKEETNWLKSKDPSHLCSYVDDTFRSIPKLQDLGNSPSSYQHTLGRLKALDSNITRGLGGDAEGKITPEQIQWLDDVRSRVYQYVDDLIDRTEGWNAMRNNQQQKIRQKHKKRASKENSKCGICSSVLYHDSDVDLPLCLSCLDDKNRGLKKEATSPRFKGLSVVMTPFQRAIAGTLINATVSGGQNIEDVYDKLNKKYKFSDREELEILQILADLGYPIYKDRVLMNSDDGPGEWIKNYDA